MKRILVLLTLVLAAALPAAGQGIVGATVNGNSVSVTISLPGGLGADVTLGFEEVTNLSLQNLGLSAQLANPLDLTFLSRFPRGTLLALPVILRIEPPPAGGLSFKGVAGLEIHTSNLEFTLGTPLRLFSAPLDGRFEDITAGIGAGSYRARGTMGGFSEFVIVLDLRAVNQVITGKFDRLEDLLEAYEGAMPGSVYDDLETRLAAARADFESGATLGAIQKIDGFLAVVEQHSGTDIPDVWRSARDLVNMAGYLRAGATTLRFSLELKRAGGL
ncbi:MAG TPA: DUF6689 family protein [Thermoanaerobaculia bacterium]|nr:DUF6689 family protein [Thermoanaerobaculia bacterium]